MNFNAFQAIKNEYERRRKAALDDLESRKAQLYHKIPRLEEIEDEITRAGLKYNKAILMGMLPTDSAVRKLSETIEGLKSEKAGILSKYGYDCDCLSPVWHCEKCCDTGVIKSQEGGPDTICSCYRQQLIDMLYDQSNLSIINNEGFQSFRTDYYPDVADEHRYGIKKSPRSLIRDVLQNCMSFVGNFCDNSTKNMLFCGPTGVGKTFMAGSVAMELMKLGHTVLYQTAPALFNTIYEYRYNSANNDDWESALYKSILESDLLIIDDLGTESPSGMRYAELLNILDTRMANDTRRPCKTIISTNIDLKKLFEYYDERIVSRITGGFDIFMFAGEDIRRLKALKS